MKSSVTACIYLWATLGWITFVNAQQTGGPIRYPGYPSGDCSPEWQKYFQVTEPLPNVTFDFGRHFAGNLPVQRGQNLSLYFWAVENKPGSLTAGAEDTTSPWQIWLQGGPGSSSLFGFFVESGPIRLNADYSASANNYSFHKLADTIWVDQPVGTGFATLESDGTGWVADEDQMASDFFGFLENLVKVFPSLAKRPLHILGESYAGTYIPYITKHYFGLTNTPVNLATIVIGDGTLGNGVEFELISTVTVVKTWPQVIGYDPEVFEWFQEQNHLCGYDLNLTYPQEHKFPTLKFQGGGGSTHILKRDLYTQIEERHNSLKSLGLLKRDNDREEARQQWKRDLSLRDNGTIDSWYGCSLLAEVVDYAVNYTWPWSANDGSAFDVYEVPSVLKPSFFGDASVILNDQAVKKAIHAPDVEWLIGIQYDFGNAGTGIDPSPEPMVFLDELATNATRHGISIILTSGNADALVPQRGTEVAIQNTTFGGIQGFTRKPSTPWYDDGGTFAGIVHQERGWTYALFAGAGHFVPNSRPVAAFTFLREFVLGNNQTGLVTTSSSGEVIVIGGEDATLAGDILKEPPEIYLGSWVTTSTYTFPSATIAQWDNYFATATSIPSKRSSGATSLSCTMSGWLLVFVFSVAGLLSL